MSPAQPFPNKSWYRGSDLKVITLILTNVWTPDKYPDWKGPPGFLAGLDPTWIPSHLRQCAFCEAVVCSCIYTIVRQDGPSIKATPNMGEGAWAGTDYEAGEFLGELVGEIAPIGYYTDGWAADLSRDDLSPDGKNVVWCQIYPRYMGNWYSTTNMQTTSFDHLEPQSILWKTWYFLKNPALNVPRSAESHISRLPASWLGIATRDIIGRRNTPAGADALLNLPSDIAVICQVSASPYSLEDSDISVVQLRCAFLKLRPVTITLRCPIVNFGPVMIKFSFA
ncbi:Ff.00g005490.m01.CDS01 [Fusarium sp. VM40]|nr:Ff.00g005490.m01.CDS01 [Fusarium sp. VM40]